MVRRVGQVAVLELLHVIDVLVGLHMNREVTFGCGGVVADVTPVGFVTASVSLSTCEARMRLIHLTVHAVHLAFGVLFLHVDFEGLLVLVVPVALGALEGLTRVSRVQQGQVAAVAAAGGATSGRVAGSCRGENCRCGRRGLRELTRQLGRCGR